MQAICLLLLKLIAPLLGVEYKKKGTHEWVGSESERKF
jgi:hypothetical protein